MYCPICNNNDTHVKDSRVIEDGTAIRRRRTCPKCGHRFVTVEKSVIKEMYVIKKNGETRPFDRNKIMQSLLIALRKRETNIGTIDNITNKIVSDIMSLGEYEIKSSTIGQMVMESLKDLDKVAYVRFASVYKDFCEVNDFEQFLQDIKNKNLKTDQLND